MNYTTQAFANLPHNPHSTCNYDIMRADIVGLPIEELQLHNQIAETDEVYVYTSAAVSETFLLKLLLIGNLLRAKGLFCNLNHINELSKTYRMINNQGGHQWSNTQKICLGKLTVSNEV